MWLYIFFFFFALAFIAPRPKLQNKTAAGLSEIQINTTSADRNIPYLAGKDYLKNANAFWYGDLDTIAITKKVKTGAFSSDKVVIGHKYLLGVGLALVYGPGVKIHEVHFDDKKAWTGTIAGGATITLDNPTLFGAADEEGGVKGSIKFYDGNTAQMPDAYLKSQIGEVPAYRYLAYLSFQKFSWGNSYRLPMVNVIASRYPDPLEQGANAIIGEDANAAYIVYELMTSLLYGVGIDPVYIENSSVIAVAQKLYDEGFGLTFSFDTALVGDDAVEQIMRHINANLYRSTITGKISIALVRGDYIIASLPVINDTSLIEVNRFDRGALESLSTELKVRYINREENYKPNIEPALNTAARFIVQRPNSQEIAYYGVRSKSLANQIAWRDLVTISTALAVRSIKTTRAAFEFTRGTPFVLASELHNITPAVYRAMSVGLGTLTDNSIDLDIVEDSFGFGQAIFLDSDDSGFEPLIEDAEDVTIFLFESIPYYHLSKLGLEPTYAMTFLAKPNPSSLDYDIWVVQAGEYVDDTTDQPFTNMGLLTENITAATNTIKISATQVEFTAATLIDIRENGVNLAIIEGPLDELDNPRNEWIAFTNASYLNGFIILSGVQRGLLDTTPHRFYAGVTRVWLADLFGINSVQQAFPTTMNMKFLSTSLKNTLEIDDATARSFVVTNRAALPYPIREFRVNGQSNPTSPVGGELTFTWKSNNNSTESFPYQSDADITAPVGTTYDLSVYNSQGIHRHSGVDLTAKTHTWEIIPEIIAGGGEYETYYEVRITAKVDGVASLYQYIFTFDRLRYNFETATFNLTDQTGKGDSFVNFNLTEALG